MKQGDTVTLTVNNTIVKTSLLVQMPAVGKPCIVGNYNTEPVLSVDVVEFKEISFTTAHGTHNLKLVENNINAIFNAGN